MKFSKVVKTKTGTCAKCFSITYALPCTINTKIVKFLKDFGKPSYAPETTKILSIDSGGFQIEARIGAKIIKFVMPKKYEKLAPEKMTEKIKFEKALAEWMTDTLGIEIEI